MRTFDLTVTNLTDRPEVGAVVANLRDVTERNALLEQLARQAVTDTLTGLANRAALHNTLRRALSPSATGTTATVLYCDLDGFKAVNDAHGHDVGDRLLCALSERLRTCVADPDLLARIGGDEFVVALVEPDPDGRAEHIAAAIVSACSEPVLVDDLEVNLSASVGIATAGTGEDVEGLLRRADQAMYRAKAAGWGNVRTDPRNQVGAVGAPSA